MKIPVSKLDDSDMQAAPVALVRAAENARRLAEQTGTRFAAQLLFQFRVEKPDGRSNKRRICEERIIHIVAANADTALQIANNRGKEEEFNYEESNGDRVYFEFVGVTELIELTTLNGDDEVWSRFMEKITPIERKDKLIPSPNMLAALRGSRGKIKL